MTVYVLFHETNSGKFDESDGYIEAMYATKELADAGYLVTVRAAIEDGTAVYYNPDTEDEDEHWTDDWRVEAHEVLESVEAESPARLNP